MASPTRSTTSLVAALILCLASIGVFAGLSVGARLAEQSTAGTAVLLALGATVIPVVLYAVFRRYPSAATLLLWIAAFVCCFVAVVPLWAGVAAALIPSKGVARQSIILLGTTASWAAHVLVPVLAHQDRANWKRAIVLTAFRTVPMIAGILLAVLISRPGAVPAVVSVGLALSVVLATGVVGELLYVRWLRSQGMRPPHRLVTAIARVGRFNPGPNPFADIVTLPSDWPGTVVEVRLSERGRAALVITQRTIDRLTDTELEAVLAHEMKHVLGDDLRAAAVTSLSLSLVAGLVLWQASAYVIGYSSRGVGAAALPCMGVIYVRTALEFLFSRWRERAADEYAATLVGPAPLASALRKLSDGSAPGGPWGSHDRLEERLARLEALDPVGHA